MTQSTNDGDFWDSVCIPADVPEDPSVTKGEQRSYKGTTLLVDADIIAFQSASTTDGRQYTLKDKNFKYKKDAVEYATRKGFDPEGIELTYNPEPEAFAIRNVNQSVKALRNQFPGASLEMYLTGPTNFRKQISKEYKKDRRDKRKPVHLKACKAHVLKKYNGIQKDLLEADDLMGIECIERPGSTIICTIDKDLDCIPGRHYNWRKDKLYTVSPLEAYRNFYKQCLTGDNTDSIPGLHGIGPKTAEKILKGCTCDYEMYTKVLEEWHKKLLPKGLEDLSSEEVLKKKQKVQAEMEKSAQMLWILREPLVMWKRPVKESKCGEVK
jgi:DNA polymerase-1